MCSYIKSRAWSSHYCFKFVAEKPNSVTILTKFLDRWTALDKTYQVHWRDSQARISPEEKHAREDKPKKAKASETTKRK
jgi:hypothetical protein